MNIHEDIIQQELERRKKIFLNINLFFMIMIASLYFATLNIPNNWTHIIILVVEGLCIGTLWSNYVGKSYLAGFCVVSICELGLMAVIATTRPFDTTNLPLLDLFVMAISLTVSLLPARFVFVIASINTCFIFAVLLYQSHTALLNAFLVAHFYNAFIRPAALQWICVGISYIWVRSTNQSIAKTYALQMENYALRMEIERLLHQIESKNELSTPVVETNLENLAEKE